MVSISALSADSRTIAERAQRSLADAFGSRLRGLVLYGSSARGDGGPDSDFDLLVLLEGPIRLGDDLRTTIGALYPLQLETERLLHAMPVAEDIFDKGEYALYRHAKAEGARI